MNIHRAVRAVERCRSCCCGSPAAKSFSTRALHRHRTALVQARWWPECSASSGALVRSGAWQRSPQRRLSSAAPGGAADGKPGPKPLDRGNTPMRKGFDVLSSESGSKCVITGYDPHGFDVGRVNARSSILAFPGSFLLWAPRSFDEITLESLELIALTEPKPDVLLVGSGRVFNMRLDPQIMAYFKKHGIRVDVMDTRNAAATFNVLNSEDRLVVAALLKLDPHDPPPGYFAAAAAADPMLEKAHGRRGPQ